MGGKGQCTPSEDGVCMGVREGYKQTEVGVIPEDWSSICYADYLNIISGIGFKKSEYCDVGIRLLRIDNVSYGQISWDSIAYLPFQYTEKFSNLVLVEGDILLALNRPITNNQLKLARMGAEDSPAILYQRVGKIGVINRKLNKRFAYFVLRKYVRKFVEESSVGSDQPFVSTTELKKIYIPLPPLSEQTAIATVLSNADALIQSLRKLIAKKRLIKQGAMQELLKPKEDWVVQRLGYLLDYEQPTKYLVADTEYNNNNDTPVLTAGKTFILGYTNETNGIFENNLPVIIFDDFTTTTKFVTFPFKAKSSALKILKPKNETVNVRFVFEAMQTIIFPLGDHKRYWISEYQHLEIQVPTSEEQTRIAQILSDMDAEITALQTKLDKYKQIKQGMMQELLTGRIRLI
ncbi:MAG: Type-1 restriction enzyme MjaXIP specificity protein [Candidatus Syntrophoarchaeum sp. GoM_oil]|nr:MAG: Type-1 restriction enzyme MjaXIP specificity protein [Candidatus Syntrophoarchaeum sp. GoM_oil]